MQLLVCVEHLPAVRPLLVRPQSDISITYTEVGTLANANECVVEPYQERARQRKKTN